LSYLLVISLNKLYNLPLILPYRCSVVVRFPEASDSVVGDHSMFEFDSSHRILVRS
jgi:hypothetical protein